jgi:hypothetical protein
VSYKHSKCLYFGGDTRYYLTDYYTCIPAVKWVINSEIPLAIYVDTKIGTSYCYWDRRPTDPSPHSVAETWLYMVKL